MSTRIISSCYALVVLSPLPRNPPIRPGMVVHIGHWIQFILAQVLEVDERLCSRCPVLALALERTFVHPLSVTSVLCHVEGMELRVVGTISLSRHWTT